MIGGSIGLRARALGWDVVAWEPDPIVLRAARAAGIVSAVATSLSDAAARADVLVLAAPVDAAVVQLRELAAGAADGLPLVLDVGSVKVPAALAGAGIATFVPTHPLAGSEKSGPSAARADLFLGRTWAYDPDLHPQACGPAVRFIADMGARPFAIASERHDRLVALSSHLPQILSVALGARLGAALGEPGARELCGPGMRSMLRLAASSYAMWKPVLALNARPLAQEVRALAAILQGAADALDGGEPDDLEALFGAAAESARTLAANQQQTAPSAADDSMDGKVRS